MNKRINKATMLHVGGHLQIDDGRDRTDMGRFKDVPTDHWNQSGSEKWRRMGREGWKKEILTEISLQIWSWHE